MSRQPRAGLSLLKHLQTVWQLGSVAPIDAGMSDAAVFRVGSDRFLKLAEDEASAATLREEIARTQWLAVQGVRVPKTLLVHDDGASAAWLSQALPGTGADASSIQPAELVPLLGRALRKLHALPASTCPFDETIAARLAVARRDIDRGAVEPDHFDDRNAGLSPEDIFGRLARSPPTEELVVAHGDATLSNMIVGPDGAIGFVDCGRAGRADRYLDLAVTASYVAEQFGDGWIAPFARAYGEVPWQNDKALYFLDLYELF